MEEAYCSYEVSKLLKKNGFDGRTYKIYRPNGRGSTIGWVATNTRLSNHEFLCNCITRPTHQMACAWLREHNLMNLDIRGYGVFEYDTQERTSVFAYDVEVVYMRDMTLLASFYGAKSYEEAVEWGLIHALQWNSEHIDKRQQL